MDDSEQLGSLSSLLELASSDPAAALPEAQKLAADGVGEARVLGLLAEGIARRGVGDVNGSIARLVKACELAAIGTDLAADCSLSLAGSFGFAGRMVEAIEILDQLVGHPSPLLAAKAEHQRATLFQRIGQRDKALAGYRQALTIFRRQGDFTAEGHLHTNLAILATYEGRISDALAELDMATGSYELAGALQWQAMTLHNRGWTVSCTGDLPRALRLFDEAEQRFAAIDIPPDSRLAVRAEALFRAGLTRRAYSELVVAVEQLHRLGLATDEAEALVLASRAATMSGRPEEGRALAERAERMLGSQGRDGWSALAVAAGLDAGADEIETVDPVELANDLLAAGHGATALHVLLAAAGQAVRRGQVDRGRTILKAMPAIELTPSEEVRLAVVEAVLLSQEGQADKALQICESAYTSIDRLIGGIGSLDLIAGASFDLDQLVQTAKRVLSPDAPTSFLVWADRRRAIGARRWPRTRSSAVTQLLNRYRAVDGQVLESIDDGSLRSQLTSLRAEIEEAAWTETDQRRTQPAVAEPLHGTTLDLSLLTPSQVRVTISTADGVRWQRRANDTGLGEHLDRLHRLWMGAASGPQARLGEAVAEGAAELERSLFGPDPEWAEPITLDIDPEFRAIPFGCLPSLAGRCHRVRPWHRQHSTPVLGGGRLVLLDRSLRTAATELRALRTTGDWDVVDAARSVDDVVDAIAQAEVVHISTHGGVEPQNPLFSWLGLPTGRLYLYDLVRMPTAPRVVVIGACLGARGWSHGAAGTLSFAEAFLGAGCHWVIASGSVIPDDEEMATHLAELHVALRAGVRPDEALSLVQQAARDRGERRTAAALTCYTA